MDTTYVAECTSEQVVDTVRPMDFLVYSIIPEMHVLERIVALTNLAQ